MERKWTDRQSNVQYNSDVAHQDVIMYCNKNQFPEFTILWSTFQISWRKGVEQELSFAF